MSKILLAPGVLVGLLSLLTALANWAGYPVAVAVLSDPATAAHATMILTGLGGIVAGVLRGASTPGGSAIPAPGLVAGLVAFAGAVANAAGAPVLGPILSDPTVAAQATEVLTGLGAGLAGVLAGVRKPAA